MKVPYAARCTALLFLITVAVTLLLLRPGWRVAGVQFPRQGWLLANPLLWQVGGWLWLVTIFGWMWLLTALAWSYLPAHRVAAMLQSGLMLIGAILSIAGVITWMSVLPIAVAQPAASSSIALVDGLAAGLLGGGAFMAGIATTWIGLELWQQRVLARPWVALCVLAGLFTIPSPFLLPWFYHLLPAALCWWLWSLYLAFLPRLPSPFTEWPVRR